MSNNKTKQNIEHLISDGNMTDWASDFKSDEGVVWGWFEITSSITPALYNTKSNDTNINCVNNKIRETF